jgi:hypothetical protein
MAARTKIDPAEAKAVWDDMEAKGSRPSARRVAQVMTAAGRPISHAAVAKWRSDGWAKKVPSQKRIAPLDKLDALVPAITGDPMKRLDSLPDVLPDMAPEEMLEQNLKRLSQASAKVLFAVQNASEEAILEQPVGIGSLMEAAARVTLISADALTKIEAVRVSKAVDVSPTSQAERVLAGDPLAAAFSAIDRIRQDGIA